MSYERNELSPIIESKQGSQIKKYGYVRDTRKCWLSLIVYNTSLIMNQSILRSTETLVPTEVQHQQTTLTDCVSNNYSPTQDRYIDAFSDQIKV